MTKTIWGANVSPIQGCLGTALKGWLWSDDRIALYIPKLRLTAPVVRATVNLQTLYILLGDVLAKEHDDVPCDAAVYGYVWGDFKLYDTAEPLVEHVLLWRSDLRASMPFNDIYRTLVALRKKYEEADPISF